MKNDQQKKIQVLGAEAKQLHLEAEAARNGVETGINTALEKAWQCGKRLNAIKLLVGHGNWLTWLGGSLPGLTESTAQRYMKIDRDNPNTARVRDLKFDAIRKHCLTYVPEKEHPQLPGDKKVAKSESHLGLVNDLNKFFRRYDEGHIKGVTDLQLQKDFRVPFERLQRLFI
jgi:hypothetical protein